MVFAPTLLPIFSGLSRKEIAAKLAMKNFHSSISLQCYENINEGDAYYRNLLDSGQEAKLVGIAECTFTLPETNASQKFIPIDKTTLTIFPGGVSVIRSLFEIRVEHFNSAEAFDLEFSEFARGILKKPITEINVALGGEFDKPLHLAWVHKVFLTDWSNDENQKIISARTISEFQNDRHDSFFGWGESVVNIASYNSLIPLYEGCSIAQYFYFSFHRFNKLLPNVIAQLNSSYKLGQLVKVRKRGEKLKQTIFELEMQYADFMHSVVGVMREPASQFDERWRLAELRTNLRNKVPVLQDLLQDVENRTSRQSDAFVQAILFAVSILSLVGLFLGAHDYLTKPKDQHKSTLTVIRGMLPTNLDDVLSFAVGLSLISVIIFLLIKLWFRKK